MDSIRARPEIDRVENGANHHGYDNWMTRGGGVGQVCEIFVQRSYSRFDDRDIRWFWRLSKRTSYVFSRSTTNSIASQPT